MKPKRSEAEGLHEVQRLLTARGIFWLRHNVTKLPIKGQWVKFGHPGEADIVAYPSVTHECCGERVSVPVFIETKSSTGKQSKAQIMFQRAVEAAGMTYLLCRSAAEVEDWLMENCQ